MSLLLIKRNKLMISLRSLVLPSTARFFSISPSNFRSTPRAESRLPFRSSPFRARLFSGSAVTRQTSTMDGEASPLFSRKQASSRICSVSSFSTELLEIHSAEPSLHILFVPGNPGVISFYKDFVEALYELLDGNASITAIGHIGHTRKDWDNGRKFSLQEQIEHKVDFIKQMLLHDGPPLVLVGHSIGSYACLEVFKRFRQKVKFSIGLYPFLTLNRASSKQAMIGKVARSPFLSACLSSFISFLGLLPTSVSSVLVKTLYGQSWSSAAVSVTCSHLLQYHTMCNVLFMAKTEFEKLSEEPDWSFMKKHEEQMAFLFGVNDHWGPLSCLEEISRKVPGTALTIEREGLSHSYCCSKAGSIWVARYVANMIARLT